MELLALPEDLLRLIISKLSLRVRLKLRQTCSTLSNLIADTHFSSMNENSLSLAAVYLGGSKWPVVRISLGNLWFRPFPFTVPDEIKELLQCLFRSCKMNKLTIHLHGDLFTLDFLRSLICSFKVNELVVHTAAVNIDIALQLLTDFPSSKHSLVFKARPTRELLFSLPPLHCLHIMNVGSNQDKALKDDEFMRLMATHHSIQDESFRDLTSDSLKQVFQLVSDRSDRRAALTVSHDKMKSHLTNFGISKDAREGDRYGKFLIKRRSHNGMQLLYGKCLIELVDFSWEMSRPRIGIEITSVQNARRN